MARHGAAPGERRGGRTKGTPNKATVAKAAEIAASGLTPLDYLIGVMRNEKLPTADRMEAAKAAAPYVHPKLSAVEMGGSMNMTHEEWIDILDEQRGM
jgi:hypothetical protein